MTRRGDGNGMPNADYALALALYGTAVIRAIACDTDGVACVAEVVGPPPWPHPRWALWSQSALRVPHRALVLPPCNLTQKGPPDV